MKEDSGFRLFIIVLLFALLPAYSNALIEEKSSVVGSILGAGNKPLAGVTIRLLDSFFLNEVARVQTDATGKFSVSNILPGLYLVSVDSPALTNFFKRIQVVSGSPTLVDIKPLLNEKQLKEHNAWDKLKWTIRVAQRNPLRHDENQFEDVDLQSDQQLGAFLSSMASSHNLELSFINIAGVQPSLSANNQLARVSMQGQWQDQGEWSVKGNFLDGAHQSYSASADIEYTWASHRFEAAFGANDVLFAKSDLLQGQNINKFLNSESDFGVDGSKSWVTSVELGDAWQLHRQVRIDYGTRVDYYGYLNERMGYSPRLQLSYDVLPPITIRGVYYRNQTAPGNYFLHAKEPIGHSIGFVPYQNNLDSEVTTGYQAGVDFESSSLQVSMSYYNEEVLNKIAAISLTNSPVNQHLQVLQPFVLFNARDLNSRGFEFQVSKPLSTVFTLVGTYHLKEAVPVFIVEKRKKDLRQLYFVNGRDHNKYHDVQAGLQALIPDTETEIYANWKWSSGSPLVFGRKNEELMALDIDFYQGIPIAVISDSQVRLMFSIKNLLDQNLNSRANADFQHAMIYGMPRLIAGGIHVKF